MRRSINTVRKRGEPIVPRGGVRDATGGTRAGARAVAPRAAARCACAARREATQEELQY